MSPGPALVVTACERGRGGGHLGRSLLLLRTLREKGVEAYLWIPEPLKDDFLSRFREFFTALDAPAFLSREEELAGRDWAFVVLDRFKTGAGEFAFWSSLGPLIGIDEGGPKRGQFDFLIDLLPPLYGPAANLRAPGLLPLPRKRRPAPAAPDRNRRLKALVSFGAEDSAGLGIAAARAFSRVLKKHGAEDRFEITLVSPVPPDDSEADGLSGVKVTGKIPGLMEHLADYDLFITHFGLGAFEAVYARVPVLLVSPTAYHEKLGRNAGFYSLGAGPEGLLRKRALARLARETRGFLESLEKRRGEIARRFGLEEDQKETLGSYVSGLEPRVSRACPVCGKRERPGGRPAARARFPEETYRRCRFCGALYLDRLTLPPVEYGKEYFFGFYKKQYGKTYLEDFPELMETGRRRLARIRPLLGGNDGARPRLLDIGCAYGPFLAAAAESGFAPYGVDPAEDAVRYVREELGFPAWRGFFPAALPEEFRAPREGGGAAAARKACFDAVTLWYVIEHFEDTGKTLAEIHRLLGPGGVLAFSTPSFSGISGRKSPRAFLEKSPPDHRTVLSPRLCKKIFRRWGFRLCKIVVTGHHPERFPLLGRFARPGKKTPLSGLLLFISRVFRLGDTFEAYGVKTPNSPASSFR